MRARTSIALLALLATAACGGGGSDDNNNPTDPGGNGGATNGTWTAKIGTTNNGPVWSAVGTITVSRQANNFIGLGGSGYAGSTPYSLVLGIANATAPGTHTLTPQSGGDGSSLIVGGTSTGWGTAFAGGTGSVTITLLTATRIKGTFSGNVIRGSGAAAAPLWVVDGAFDITF